MTTVHERARNELAAAIAKNEGLARIPEEDTFNVGDVIRWRPTGVRYTYTACKDGEVTWFISGLDRSTWNTWQHVVRHCGTNGVDFFEVATGWQDSRLPVVEPPPVEVEDADERGRLVIRYNGYRWRYSPAFNQWVRSEDGS